MEDIVKLDTSLIVTDTQPDIKVGDCFIYSYDKTLYKVTKIDKENNKYFIRQINGDGYFLQDSKEEAKSKETLKEYYDRILFDYDKVKELAKQLLEGKQIEESEEAVSETALMNKYDKNTLLTLKEQMSKSVLVAEQVKKVAQSLISQKMSELQAKLAPMTEMISQMNKQIKRIDYVIQTIEIYAGIKEDVIQLRKGVPADEETPVVFRQAVIYMDEELALDFEDFEWTKEKHFDEWLVKDDNWKHLLPDEKSMIAIKPRRTDYKYSKGTSWEDAIYNFCMNQRNKRTIFIIRNGENIYKIESENIALQDKMFPGKTEYASLLEKEKTDHWESRKDEDNKQTAIFRRRFTQVAFLMQGLLERSDVFSPHKVTQSLINSNGFNDEHIKLLYELDNVLSDGRDNYTQWHDKLVENLQEGQRVIVVGCPFDADDFIRYYEKNREPALPDPGIYTLIEIPEKYKSSWRPSAKFMIQYLPGDTVFDAQKFEFVKRTKRVSIIISPYSLNVLPYDIVSEEDIDYYLHSRLHRSKYYEFVKVMKSFKKLLEQERQKEADYVKMWVAQIMSRGYTMKPGFSYEDPVYLTIKKVKDRLKWKRYITEKDEATYTLIERSLFSKASVAKFFNKVES
jgi:hypothetical protein